MLKNLLNAIPAMLQLALWCLTVALYVVLGILNRKYVAKRWKPALLLSCALLAMLVPSALFGIAYVDLSSFHDSAYVGLVIGLIIGVIIQLLKFAWNIMLFGVAEAEWRKTGWGFSLTTEQKKNPSWHELVQPCLFGVAAAVVTTVLFKWLDVREGPILITLQRLFPDAESAPDFVTVPVACLFVTSVAVAEELAYRGGILAYILRVTRKSRLLTWLGIILLNLPWALAHIPNTDNPVAKVTQMMILGVAFTILAKNRSMRSAIAAHVGLNLASMALAYGMGL
jgi:membrane protease YdiL (CAAX protease family)